MVLRVMAEMGVNRVKVKVGLIAHSMVLAVAVELVVMEMMPIIAGLGMVGQERILGQLGQVQLQQVMVDITLVVEEVLNIFPVLVLVELVAVVMDSKHRVVMVKPTQAEVVGVVTEIITLIQIIVVAMAVAE
jgi:hypothetical protein